MAKKVKITDQRKIRGIRRRWLINSVGVVLLVLVLALATFSAAIWSYYYSSTTSDLQRRAESTAGGFASYTRSQYWTNAQNAVQRFEEKTKLELQFLDTSGSVQYSSNDLAAGTTPDTPEIQEALTNQEVQVWIGSDPDTGERIATASAPIVYHGQTVAVVRYVTSLVNIDRQYVLAVALACLLGAVIFALVYFSNLYFVRSIVEPIASITETARLIADGSYGVQIEKKYDDEVGELTDTINDMSLKIKQSEKTQSEFISSVSHELRTPLTAITGWAETIQSGELKNPEDVRKGMDIIVSEARRLTNMVEELLEFSRISDGRFTLSVEPMDLKAELEDAVYTYREFFRREGIELTYQDCPEEMLPISGDPERMRQVFCNLLDNAAKHGGSGKRIDVSIAQDGEEAVIRIRDYGPGIPEEELPHVKYKFYKGSSKARGSGIGLAVCEEIVTRHEGTLTIGNAEGGGCLVTIRLPIEA
ncbi:sensor histidine kinase [Pseudoflavonifractor capillosus]|uniref:sensor histidine kinase n=2 Tax=Eubacteriales TaxID=186802 RepID=UPI00195D9A5E|nr:HAMP domain-containing sensor histidine kinase [Pseudoflavonifractor capillosus]MBM6680472.1 HAMP domain-containing histidine kinase [Pseudoflavonifractor capillosus]